MAIKYNIDKKFERDIDDVLVDRWLGNGCEEMGYRSIADWLNKYMIREVYHYAGLPAVDHEIESVYETLRRQKKRGEKIYIQSFSENGVDAKEVVDDFVGYTTVYHYLTEELGVEKQKEPEDSRNWNFDLKRALLRLTRKIS